MRDSKKIPKQNQVVKILIILSIAIEFEKFTNFLKSRVGS